LFDLAPLRELSRFTDHHSQQHGGIDVRDQRFARSSRSSATMSVLMPRTGG
jgi:hypothetical protein